ncbi:MAG: ATPase [Rhodobacteraceae bacterium]|nr:MAG: ATPase [Paracoccaceae bacterium]
MTDLDKLGIWFHRPKTAMAKGATLAMFGATSGDLMIWGKVLALRPPEYLEYTLTIKPMGEAGSLVKWTLEPAGGGTRLSLEHSGLPAGAEAFGLVLALDTGWDGHMGQMRDAIHGDGK